MGEKERERERERGRDVGKERDGKHSAYHVNAALLCGALTRIFVRAVGVVATFLLLLSCPAQSVPKVRLRVLRFWARARKQEVSQALVSVLTYWASSISSNKSGIILNLAGDSPLRGKELQASSVANFLLEKEPSANITAIDSQPPGLGSRSLGTLLPFSCECATQTLSLLFWIASLS
jgi:hypothetical protein